MRKWLKLMVVLSAFLVFFTGCGKEEAPKEITDTTVVIDGEGAVTYYLFDDFEQDYYEIAGLKQMALEEAEEFNSAVGVGKAVEVVDVEKVGSRVKVTYHYDNAKHFGEHNGMNLFYGTVGEARSQGKLDDGVDLKDKKGEVTLTGSELEGLSERYILITDEAFAVRVPNKIAYSSDGVTVTGEKEADGHLLADSDMQMILILKK